MSRRRVYNASILGYMYRNQELPAALTRGQLMHLDEANNIRIKNADYLTKELCDTYTIIHGIHALNGTDLMERFVKAFRKVFANLDVAIAHAGDAIYPGADGKLYGVG